MLSSSKLKLLLNSTILLSFIFTGCLRSHKNPQGSTPGVETTTDFRIGQEVSGISIADSKSEKWKVPTEKEYVYTACLIGRSVNTQLPSGQEFSITTAAGRIYKPKTDDRGCLVWSETLPFDFSGDSTYIELVRTLKGLKTYRGSVELRIGVNPWAEYRSENVKEVIDLVRNNIAKNKMISETKSRNNRISFFKSPEMRKLLIQEKPSLDILAGRRVKNGRMITLKLNMNPFMEPLNLNGDPVKYTFKSGDFRVYAQIVSTGVGAEDNIKSQLLTTNLLPKKVEIRNDGSLILDLETKLDKYTSSGQMNLALKIEPIDAPFALASYEGLHRIGTGDLSQIFGNKGITQVEGEYSDKGFNYAKLIKESNNFDELKAAGFAHKLPTVRFSRLQPRFVRLSSGETATQRTLIFQTSTTVSDSITGAPVLDQPFHIKRSSDGEVIKTSSEDGVLLWMDEITHLYYAPIQYFFPKPEIIHVETGDREVRELAINPWDEGWTFGKDTRGLESDFKKAAARKQRSPMFIVDAFRYQTIRFRYVIDEFLTLNVKKAVVMTFDPLVQRFGIQKDRYFEPLRDGIYLMKIALVKYYIDPFKNKTFLELDQEGNSSSYVLKQSKGEHVKDQFTTVVKKLIRVQGGRITTPVEFSMRDLRMMSIRNNLIVQIETIDELKLMRDNLINEKLSELQKDYDRYNDPSTTPEEKAQILTDKFELLKVNSASLLESMKEEIGLVRREREALSEPYFKSERFDKLDQLQKNLENETLNLEGHSDFVNYKKTMNLKKEEFAERIEKIRSNMSSMELKMADYWQEWSDTYLASFKAGTMTEGLHLQATTEEIKEKSESADAEELAEYERKKKLGLPVVPEENRFARVSYYDYLASMQIFTKESSIGIGIEPSDLERLKINNYTENPAAPLIDLNLYKNKAGLAPRAFIGPCTLVEDDNMSDMRPTDTLDESASGRMDSSEVLYKPRFVIDNSRFESSAYHDSLSPFKSNLNLEENEETILDKYIREHINNEKMYEHQMDAIAQMGNFTKSYNLEYVSLDLDGKKRSLKIFDDNCKFENDIVCLKDSPEDQTSKENFITSMNSSDMWTNLKRYFYLNPMGKLKRENKKLLNADYDFPTIWEELYSSTSSLLDYIKFKPIYFHDKDKDDDFDPSHTTYYYKDAKEYLNNKLDGKFRNFEKFDAAKWLSGGLSDLRLVDAIKLCDLLAKQNIKALEDSKKSLINPDAKSWFREITPYQYLLDSCLASVKYMPTSDQVHLTGLTFDRRYRVIKPGEYRHVSGKSMNINVGADISISNYQDIGSAASVGTNGALLGLAAGIVASKSPAQSMNLKTGVIGAIGNAPHPLAKLLKGALLVGGGVMIANQSATKAAGINDSFSTSISEAVFLVVQKAEMEFTIEEHEKCLVTQFTRGFIENLDMKMIGVNEGVKKNDPDLIRNLSRGIVLCGGKVMKKPETVMENFYYVTQHFTAGDMLDKANLLNHVWLLALRGTHDYNNFLRILKAKVLNKNGDSEKETQALYEYPLHHLNSVYERVTPSFPGMYSVPHGCNPLADKKCDP